MKDVYLSFGSNVGDRYQNILMAISLINAQIGPIGKISSIYESEAWGENDQDDFYNVVVQLIFDCNPIELLNIVQKIENKLGRTRFKKWGPRIIDIDIIIFGTEIIQTCRLTIPHPYIEKRKFVLLPLVEIAPNLVHPGLNNSFEQLLKECMDKSRIKIVCPVL